MNKFYKRLSFCIILLSLSNVSQADINKYYYLPDGSLLVSQYVESSEGIDIVREKINTYLSSIIPNVSISDSLCSGFVDFAYAYRNSNSKSCYSFHFIVSLSEAVDAKHVNPKNQITLHVQVPYTEGYSILCDKSQTKTEIKERINTSPEAIQEHIFTTVKNIISGIKRYLENGEIVDVLKQLNPPPYLKLDYIVEHNQLTYYSVLHSDKHLKSNELFNLLKNYFTYTYNQGSIVIQVADEKENMILGKGIYGSVAKGTRTIALKAYTVIYDVPHIIRVDCKDERVRVMITINEYTMRGRGLENRSFYPIKYQPFTDEKDRHMDTVLRESEKQILSHIYEIQEVINGGNTSIDMDNW